MSICLRRTIPLLAFVVAIATSSSVFANPQKQDGPPPRIDFASALQIDAKTAQAVEQILREQHEKRVAMGIDHETVKAKLDTLRQETDQKLSRILTVEQRAKLHQLLPKPPRPDERPPTRD